jgi:hypothetical protein
VASHLVQRLQFDAGLVGERHVEVDELLNVLNPAATVFEIVKVRIARRCFITVSVSTPKLNSGQKCLLGRAAWQTMTVVYPRIYSRQSGDAPSRDHCAKGFPQWLVRTSSAAQDR